MKDRKGVNERRVQDGERRTANGERKERQTDKQREKEREREREISLFARYSGGKENDAGA